MRYLGFFILILLLFACNQEPNTQKEDQKKQLVKEQEAFQAIEKAWIFSASVLYTDTQNLTNGWNSWVAFRNFLAQKPKTSLQAFKEKAKTLHEKSLLLTDDIPQDLQKQEIFGRVHVIQTECKNLEMYLALQQVPVKEVNYTVVQLNQAILDVENRINEIYTKSKIPLEKGELEMLQRLKDTSRAAKNTDFKLTPSEQN
jgi:uncharacterized coiled-coil protein SlyX